MINFKKLFSSAEPVKIGHLTPLSGEYAYFGEWEKEGVDLAAEELNKKGGVDGREIIVLREDDRMDPALSTALLGRLIDAQNVQAIIGSPSSDVLLAVAPIAEKNKVVMLTALAGSTEISNASEYLFRTYPTTVQEGEQLAAAASRAGYKKTAVIYINNQYGIELAKSVKRKAGEFGIEISATEGYRKDNVDFSELLGRIKEKKPEAIFLLGYPRDMELILRQAKVLGIESKYLAPDTFLDPKFQAGIGHAAEGVVYVAPVEIMASEFVKNFRNKYEKEPNIFNAMTYDALNLLALAIKQGGNNGEAIKNELLKIKDYQGASGIVTFDEHGDAINRPLKLKMIKEGKAIDYPR